MQKALTVQKKTIVSAVKKGVSLALSDFYYPPIPDPEVRVGNVKETSFYITPEDWKVHLNVKDVPPLGGEELVTFFRSMCRHELGHYAVCPYDTPTLTLIVGSAAEKVGPDLACFIANLFSDLIVDYYLFERYPEETVWEKRVTVNWAATRASKPSKVWMVLVKCYEKMWKTELAGKLKVPKNVEEAASKIARVIKRGGVLSERAWPRKARKIAEILKPFLEELTEPPKGVQGEYVRSPAGGRFFVPEDVARTMRGNPLGTPLRGRGESCEKAAEKYAEAGGGRGDFVEAARAAGLTASEREALRAWYRAKANMRINVRLRSSRRGGGEVPVYPDVWRLEDPIEELDIPLSFQSFPRLIPGVTTKKWVRFSGEVEGGKGAPPDLLIVLDSSGSMEWREGGPFDLALIAAFSALKFAMSRSCKVAAINFSDRAIECGWTRDRVKVEDTLLKYQGGGTVLPTGSIVKAVRENRSNILVLIITDTEIANWDEAVNELGGLAAAGHSVCMFFIGGRPASIGERHRKFLSAGGKIYTVPSVRELPDVVIDEVKGYYR